MSNQTTFVGRTVRRKAYNSTARIMVEKKDRLLIKGMLWRGWVLKETFYRDWQFVETGQV